MFGLEDYSIPIAVISLTFASVIYSLWKFRILVITKKETFFRDLATARLNEVFTYMYRIIAMYLHGKIKSKRTEIIQSFAKVGEEVADILIGRKGVRQLPKTEARESVKRLFENIIKNALDAFENELLESIAVTVDKTINIVQALEKVDSKAPQKITELMEPLYRRMAVIDSAERTAGKTIIYTVVALLLSLIATLITPKLYEYFLGQYNVTSMYIVLIISVPILILIYDKFSKDKAVQEASKYLNIELPNPLEAIFRRKPQKGRKR